MRVNRLVFIVAVVWVAIVGGTAITWAQGCPTSPNYTPDFSSNGACMTLNGSAALVPSGANTVLQITSSGGDQTGSVWFNTPQVVENGFTTTFKFQFTNPSNPPADGIAFVIQNASSGTAAIGYTGGNGGAIAYGDADLDRNPSQGAGIPHSLAVEFDTYWNAWDPQPQIIGGVSVASHVAVQSCGTGPNTSHHGYLCGGDTGPNSTLGSPVLTANQADQKTHTVIITYNAACPTCTPATTANLQVSLDGVEIYPNGISVDLSSIGLGPGGTAYVGITGATGGKWETQQILNWTWTQQGQPINANDPASLTQNFVSNNTPNQHVQFDFDYSVAQANNDLTIESGTTPFVNNPGISQANWATITNGTEMADAPCLLEAANPSVCAVAILTCTTSSNSTPSGANCPQSTVRNMLFDTITDIVQNQTGIINGTQYPTGIVSSGTLTIPAGYAPGLAMAPDVLVSGQECSYPGNSPMANDICPRSILTALDDGSPKPPGTTKITNSSFVFFCCAPEWNTAATIPLWSNSTSVPASFTSEPPTAPSPDPNNYHSSQGASVTFGAEQRGIVLDTTFPLPAEQTVSNSIPCPAGTPATWIQQTAAAFSVSGSITQYDNSGTATPLTEGAWDAHYFSTDCDDMEELVFPSSINTTPGTPGPNVATFKTVPFNIDLTDPTITYNPSSPAGTYGSPLSVSVTCTDPVSNGIASGITNCGGVATSPQSVPPAETAQSVLENVTLSTSAAGAQVFNATATDQAGNQTTVAINYNVSPAALTVTASSATMNYGGTVPTITPSFSGFVNPDTSSSLTTQPTCTTTATSSSPAGSYPSTCTGALDGNYAITYVAGTVTVQAVPLAITASSASMTYGGTAPTITASYSGFVNGDTATSLTTQPTCSTTAKSSSPVGSYSSSCTGAVDANYTISYVPGSVTVNAAPLTITASSTSMTYGRTVPAIAPIISGLVNGDTATSLGTITCTTTATSSSPAGSYPSSCSGAVDANYTISYVNGSVTVGAAGLTITASNGAMIYGGSVPTITPGYIGFVNGDSPASLTSQPICSTTATSSSHVGSYPSSCAGAVDPNYSIGYVGGTVTISQAASTVTWATPAPIVLGTALSSTQLDATANVPGTFVYTPPAGTVLAAGSHILSVAFTPTDSVDYMSAGAQVNLLVTQPLISFSPSSINFGTTVKLGTIVSATVTVSNPGNAPLTIKKIAMAGTDEDNDLFTFTNNCTAAVAPGGKCDFIVKFNASELGPLALTINVSDNVTGSPQQIPVTVTVVRH